MAVIDPATVRFVMPGDVMVLLAVCLQKADDALLVVARSLRDSEVAEDVPEVTMRGLQALGLNMTRMNAIVRAIIEENGEEPHNG